MYLKQIFPVNFLFEKPFSNKYHGLKKQFLGLLMNLQIDQEPLLEITYPELCYVIAEGEDIERYKSLYLTK